MSPLLRHRRSIALVILAPVALIGAWLWWGQQDQSAAMPAGAPTPERATAPAGERDDDGTPPDATSASATLPRRVDLSGWPSTGESIVDRWALLAPLAEAGDAEAACRLGHELQTCAKRLADHDHLQRSTLGPAQADLAVMVGLNQHIEDWSREAAEIADNRHRIEEIRENNLRNAARQRESRRLDVAQCDGLTSTQRASAPRWLRLAAEGGSFDAKVAYLTLATHWRGTRGAFHDPEFARWRAHAGPMSDELLRAGDTRAAHVIHELNSGPAGHLLPRDPLRAAAARRVQEWLATEPGQRRPLAQASPYDEPLSPADAATVASLAEAMSAHYRHDAPKSEHAYGTVEWEVRKDLCISRAPR